MILNLIVSREVGKITIGLRADNTVNNNARETPIANPNRMLMFGFQANGGAVTDHPLMVTFGEGTTATEGLDFNLPAKTLSQTGNITTTDFIVEINK